MSAHSDQVESIGAYALGALPELEAQVFERHLMACGECQEELLRLTEAVEALPRSVTQHEAPPSVKAGLMEVVNAEAESARPAPQRRRFAFRLPRFTPAIAWAAAAFLVVGGLVGYGASQLGGDDEGARTLQAQVDMNRVPDGSASLSVPEDEDGSVLRVEGMPDAGQGRVYQVWVESDGEVVPVSIFDVDRSGNGAAAVPESLDDADAVMVTREPRGGSAEPTEAPLLRVDV